jgi:hypothetical protein
VYGLSQSTRFIDATEDGAAPGMVERALNAESPCVKCHTDKRGPFVFEHPPVRVEGCEICHMPHGSMNPKLLRRPWYSRSA